MTAQGLLSALHRCMLTNPRFCDDRYWKRYIYLWINYALFEELETKDYDTCRQVYRQCLSVIPHKCVDSCLHSMRALFAGGTRFWPQGSGSDFGNGCLSVFCGIFVVLLYIFALLGWTELVCSGVSRSQRSGSCSPISKSGGRISVLRAGFWDRLLAAALKIKFSSSTLSVFASVDILCALSRGLTIVLCCLSFVGAGIFNLN